MSESASLVRGADAQAVRGPRTSPSSHVRRGTRLRRLTLAIGTVAFLGLAVVTYRAEPLPGDLEIARAVQTLDGPWIHAPLWALSAIGFPPIVGLLYAAIAFAIFLAGARREAFVAALATSGAAGLHRIMVDIAMRPRPSPDLLEVAHQLPIHSSFTAGHVQNATSFFGFLCYLLCVRMAPSLRRTLILHVLVFAMVGMGIARVYFGEHWPTDVIGGYLLGVLWLIVMMELYEWLGRRADRRSSNTAHKLQGVASPRRRRTNNSLRRMTLGLPDARHKGC